MVQQVHLWLSGIGTGQHDTRLLESLVGVVGQHHLDRVLVAALPAFLKRTRQLAQFVFIVVRHYASDQALRWC